MSDIEKLNDDEMLNVAGGKTNYEIAQEVIKGWWGNGTERKKRLYDAGYDYDSVQRIVNQLLKPQSTYKDPYLG